MNGEEGLFNLSFTMHTNVEFLSTLSTNAYEFDKMEMRVHLGKSVVTFAKKIINLKVNGTLELWFQQTFVSRKRNSTE